MSKQKPLQQAIELVLPNSSSLNEAAIEIPARNVASLETQSLIERMLEIANGTQGDV
jgi:hypothetical protein